MLLPDLLTETPLLSGDAGTYQSLSAMRAAIETDRTSPFVRNAAVQAIAGAPERNFLSEVTGILDYVRERVRYTRDPLDVEYVQTPDFMLRAIRRDGTVSGDCDDSAVLFAALAEAVGYETRFSVLGEAGENYAHVIVEVRDNAGRWIPVDPSQRGRGVGWRPTVGVSREGKEMRGRQNRKRMLGEASDPILYGGGYEGAWNMPALDFGVGAVVVQDSYSFDVKPLDFSSLQPADSFVGIREASSPAAVGTSDANAGGFFSGIGDFFGGITKAVSGLLPVAERYGVVKPVVGYDAAGNPRYASSVLPVGGAYGAAFTGLTQPGPLGLPWLVWLVVGGGALVLLSGKSGR